MEHGVRESKKIYFSFNPAIELATPFLNRLSVTFSKILVGITNLLIAKAKICSDVRKLRREINKTNYQFI